MRLRLTLHHKTRQALMRQWQDALALGDRRLVKRVEAILAVAAGESVDQVSVSLALCEQSVRNYVQAFVLNGRESLRYRSSPGRPAKLTKTQKKELSRWVTAGPGGVVAAVGLLVSERPICLRPFAGCDTHAGGMDAAAMAGNSATCQAATGLGVVGR